jgi:hypothetical protein
MLRSIPPLLAAACVAAGSLLLPGCGADTAGTGSGAGAAGGPGGAGGATGHGGGGGAGTSSGVGGGFTGSGGGGGMIPVREIPNLASITFYERTGGTAPTPYEFTIDGPELTVRLQDPMGPGNFDIPGAGTEYYDVYYSDADGAFDIDGSYLTISGVFDYALPAGGGLNLAEIGLNYSGAPPEFGNYLASYVALGDNKDESSVGSCIDSDLQTHTTMGNTVGASERLRLTLGFESSSGPPPR